jgi:hypothetical protein
MASSPPQSTSVIVTNGTQESVTAWLTLGATAGCISSVTDVPWGITAVPGNALQGSFTLKAGASTKAYSSGSTGFNGSVSFGAPPTCPTSTYANGINQAEFILNNGFQQGNPQESIDISCMNGVNATIEMSATGGGADWTAYNPANPQQPQTVTSFTNKALGSNTNVVGIYPANCPACTSAQSPPVCSGVSETPSSHPVCQVQRNASDSGGTVTITFQGFLT